ncbi:MAG: Fic family protein [Bacteroidota bacterium]
MKDVDQWSDYAQYSPGRYKMFENHTQRESGKIHSYLHPDQVPNAMVKLISETNYEVNNAGTNSIETHPLTIATNFHLRLLNEIHPFADGNGRIGRIFMNLILIRAGFPPLFIKEVNRSEYMACFENSDSSGMLNFMADRLLESLKAKLDFIANQT